MKEISLSEYKKLYFDTKKCIPGEHHFVAVYLLSKFNRIPDYLNPDGMKDKCGDIVFENKTKQFSIEVKIGKTSFCFSKNETNSWFTDDKTEPFPNYLIALTQNYLFIIEWKKFSDLFVRLKKPKMILSKSGNSSRISEKELLSEVRNYSFKIDTSKEEDIKTCFDRINKEIEKLWMI
ncbi:MAG: hypothetical protein IKQ13_14565 [Treponema sp.]|nr:hypothetical protein [Treponema sp.]